MADTVSLVVEARVKDFIRKVGGEDFRCAGDVIDALNSSVEELIKSAVSRAKVNGRKTVQEQDV